jgi:hypothetical protein
MESRMCYRNEKEHNPGLQLVSAPVHDPHQAALSFAIDADADRAWFHEHRGISERRRPASPRELAGYGLAAGAEVLVSRLPDGRRLRIFLGRQAGR